MQWKQLLHSNSSLSDTSLTHNIKKHNWILVSVFTLSLTACGGGSSDPNNNAEGYGFIKSYGTPTGNDVSAATKELKDGTLITTGSYEDGTPWIGKMDAEGNLYINTGDDEDQPKSGKVISAQVGAVLRNRPDTPVLVKADRSVPYGNVVGAMVVLQRGGAESIGFVTDPLDTYPVPE